VQSTALSTQCLVLTLHEGLAALVNRARKEVLPGLATRRACRGPVASRVQAPDISYTPYDMTAVLVLLLGKKAETISACVQQEWVSAWGWVGMHPGDSKCADCSPASAESSRFARRVGIGLHWAMF